MKIVSSDRQDLSFPAIRRLGPDDLKRCVALSVDRGWSPEKAKWSLLLAACEVFGVDAPDGRGLAGAVVLTRWGVDYASVGMMLVAARYGRRGLGQALMEHLLRAAGDDATVTAHCSSSLSTSGLMRNMNAFFSAIINVLPFCVFLILSNVCPKISARV